MSRYFVIALALIAAAYRGAAGQWIESTGLMGLGAGLLLLKIARTRPALRLVAYLCFLLTAFALGAMFYRTYLTRA